METVTVLAPDVQTRQGRWLDRVPSLTTDLNPFILALVLVVGFTTCISATTVTLDFEGFPDSTILTGQYPGVTFSNAIILTAGISLNEIEFPPHSGVNVVSDNGGPMRIQFTTPIVSFDGYFTYAEPLTLQAFNASNAAVASTTSAFLNNEALSGVAGSSPNEFLQLTFAGGISSVIITGDPTGGSFALDDLTYGTQSSNSPEPRSVALFLSGVLILLLPRKRRK